MSAWEKEHRKKKAAALNILQGLRLADYGTMGELYRDADFMWLRQYCGLPYLDREAWKALWPNIPEIANFERAIRQLAQEGTIKLPDHLEAQRRSRQKTVRDNISRELDEE